MPFPPGYDENLIIIWTTLQNEGKYCVMRKTILICLIVSAFLMNTFIPVAMAASDPVMGKYLVRMGKLYYKQGDLASAVHEFTKAIMVDPGNREAQKYINRITMDGGYFVRKEDRSKNVEALVSVLEDYETKIRSLSKEKHQQMKINVLLKQDKEKLHRIISARNQENADLSADLKEKVAVVKTKTKEISRLAKRLQRLDKELASVNQEISVKLAENNGLQEKIKEIQLAAKKNIKEVQLAAKENIKEMKLAAKDQASSDGALIAELQNNLEKKIRQIAMLTKEKTKLNTRIETVKKTIEKQEQENQGLLAKVEQTEKTIKGRTTEVALLSKQTEQLNKRIEAAEKAAEKKARQAQDLREIVKTITLEAEQRARKDATKLAQANKTIEQAHRTIEEKQTEIARLSQTVFGLKDQIVAKIALIKEKDAKLKVASGEHSGLARSLTDKEKDWLAKSDRYQREIRSLEQIFERYKDYKAQSDEEFNGEIKKLHELIRKNRLDLAFLNDRLMFTQYKLSDRQSKLSGKNKLVDRLQNSLFALEKELAMFQSKDRTKKSSGDSVIAKKILEDVEKEKLIKKKDQMIRGLKMRLVSAKKRINLYEKNGIKLAALREDLNRIKLQLQAYNNPVGRANAEKGLLEAQLLQIQDKIEMVEHLLNEEGGKPLLPVQETQKKENPDLSLLKN